MERRNFMKMFSVAPVVPWSVTLEEKPEPEPEPARVNYGPGAAWSDDDSAPQFTTLFSGPDDPGVRYDTRDVFFDGYSVVGLEGHHTPPVHEVHRPGIAPPPPRSAYGPKPATIEWGRGRWFRVNGRSIEDPNDLLPAKMSQPGVVTLNVDMVSRPGSSWSHLELV